MTKGHRPIHTAFAKQGGGGERKCVCVCERERERERERKREREREREGQYVGKREFTFREGICLGYYCNQEWSWGCDRLG